MNTPFLLMAQYHGAAVIPLADVCRDYFPHLSAEQFTRKATAGQIAIPVVRIEADNSKAAKGVALMDLAQWIDERTAVARKECQQLTGEKFG